MNYRVRLEYIYSDVVHVEADNKDDAIERAIEYADPKSEGLHNAEAEEEE